MQVWRNGRRSRLKICRGWLRAGSSPATCIMASYFTKLFLCKFYWLFSQKMVKFNQIFFDRRFGMTNKKTNVTSAVFFLLMLLCNVGLVVYCIMTANSNGGKLNIDMTEPSTIRSIIYLAAVLMIMIFMFSQSFPAVIFFSLIAGGIMLFNGIKGFIDFNLV